MYFSPACAYRYTNEKRDDEDRPTYRPSSNVIPLNELFNTNVFTPDTMRCCQETEEICQFDFSGTTLPEKRPAQMLKLAAETKAA